MHVDSLFWRRDLLLRWERGYADLPRLIEGHYALQVFFLGDEIAGAAELQLQQRRQYTVTHLVKIQHQPEATWAYLLQRSLFHAEKLRAFAENSQGNSV
jgi:hypothetical protein